MIVITISFPAVDARYGQVDAVAVRKLHQIAYELGKVLFKKLAFVGAFKDEDFAEVLIPYEYGNVAEDERFTVYPTPDMNADFVYGDSYVCIDNPMKSCLIYEGDDGTYALFRTDDCDPSVKTAFKDGVKIPVKFSNQNLGR